MASKKRLFNGKRLQVKISYNGYDENEIDDFVEKLKEMDDKKK